ncbi:sensor histidine kinase [Phenylobacterium sp.]|uniref:sensor histidine kinase n=1 Tax=Phenylobacterium sp. TaxID=1871053 RepID=UPI00286A1F93|nr:sensor histidine kinase [Phenylobacterium sp.]
MPPPDLSAAVQPATAFPLCAAQCPLLAEVNHRTANQFTLLASYIHLSLEEFRKHPDHVQDLQLAFAAVEARAQALASLNRQLTERPTSREPVDVALILHDVCATFGGDDGAVHRVVDDIRGSYFVTPGVNSAVGQIVTEAIINALKYAYPADQAGDITVRSAPVETGDLVIEVVDHGLGGLAGALATAAKSFGVRLMRGLARQENITLSFIAGSPGVSVRLVLPLTDQSGGEPSVAVSKAG